MADFMATQEAPSPVQVPDEEVSTIHEQGYLVICWDDPVNLMSYVTHIFQRVFGWSRPKAEKHMLEVHEKGRSVLVRDSFEKAEFYVHQLQGYSLQATLERDLP
jgi:ATP-dependent Clp protease adaptor protein ClpS